MLGLKRIINCPDGSHHHYEEDNRNRKWKMCVYGCTVKQEHTACREEKSGLQIDKHTYHITITGCALGVKYTNLYQL